MTSRGSPQASVALVQRALARLSAHGHAPTDVARRAGLGGADLGDPTSLVPLREALEVYTLGAELLQDPAFGVALACNATSSTYGLPGLLLRHHATLGEGLRAGCEALATLIPGMDIEEVPLAGATCFRFVPAESRVAIDLLGQDLVCGMAVCGREVTATPWRPLALTLRGPDLLPAHATPYAEVLGVQPSVDGPHASITVRDDDLLLPVPTADQTVLDHLHEALSVQVRKRRGTVAARMVKLHDGVVDLQRGCVVREGRSVSLTPREVQVLRVLVEHGNEPVSHGMLEERVWSTNRWEFSHAASVTVRRLRAKLEADPSTPVNLVTLFGEGWMLRLPKNEP